MVDEVSTASVEHRPQAVADAGQPAAATDADDLGVTVERKLTSEVCETVTVTGMLCFSSSGYTQRAQKSSKEKIFL